MLTSMAFTAVAGIAFYITCGVIGIALSPTPYKYVLMVMSALASIANAVWLYNIIWEIRESMPPKRKPRKRKPVQSKHHRWWAFILVEACLALALYLFISNGVSVPMPVCVLVGVLGGLVSLLV